MFDRLLNTPVELHDLFVFVFIWDSLNKNAMPLLNILVILNILAFINLEYLIEYREKFSSKNFVYCCVTK